MPGQRVARAGGGSSLATATATRGTQAPAALSPCTSSPAFPPAHPPLPSARPGPSQPHFTGQLPLISWVLCVPPHAGQTNRQVHENLINLNATAGFCRPLHLPAPAVLAGSVSALPWDPAPRDPAPQEPSTPGPCTLGAQHPGTLHPRTLHPRSQHPGTRHPRIWPGAAAGANPNPLGLGRQRREARQSLQAVLHALLCHRGARPPAALAGPAAVPRGWRRRRGQPGAGGSSRGRPGASSLVEPACDPGERPLLSLLGPWEGIARQPH